MPETAFILGLQTRPAPTRKGHQETGRWHYRPGTALSSGTEQPVQLSRTHRFPFAEGKPQGPEHAGPWLLNHQPALVNVRSAATDPDPSLPPSTATPQPRSRRRRSARHWPAAAVHPPCFPFPSPSGETILEARNDTQSCRGGSRKALCTRYPQAHGPTSHGLWTTGARPSTEKTRRAPGPRARRQSHLTFGARPGAARTGFLRSWRDDQHVAASRPTVSVSGRFLCFIYFLRHESQKTPT